MSKGITQADGTKCYVGSGCRKHDNHVSFEAKMQQSLKSKLDSVDNKAEEDLQFSRRRNALLVIREYGDDVEVVNRGANKHIKTMVNLKDMKDGPVAQGNCWAITNELIEIVPAAEFDASWTDEISITTGARGLDHTALLVGDKKDVYVVDYTARQFHQSLPFPFIAKVDEWKDTLSKVYGSTFTIVEVSDEDDEDDYDYDDDDDDEN